jgi:hypothetical protein
MTRQFMSERIEKAGVVGLGVMGDREEHRGQANSWLLAHCERTANYAGH